MGNNRIVWIDAAKGSLILFVILGHFGISIPIIGTYIIPFYMQMFFYNSWLFYTEPNCCKKVYS